MNFLPSASCEPRLRQIESLRVLGIRFDPAPCDHACMSAQANLAAVAGEVRSAELDASVSAMAFACELESMAAGAARMRLIYLATKIGLSADATRMVLDRLGSEVVGRPMDCSCCLR
jgi:hypothetical protein